MDTKRLNRISDFEWRIEPEGRMRVPGIIYADESLIEDMDDKVRAQISNVATLPGIVRASFAMPDAHWGYGFPIGGVAAFDPREGGVISAGGVGFDISCGVRTLHTGLVQGDLDAVRERLADDLFASIPAGLGSHSDITLSRREMDSMLEGGAQWAVEQGYGTPADLGRIEEQGRMPGARSGAVSDKAKDRQRREMGTLGSGNHYLEVQRVAELFCPRAAASFGLQEGDILLSIHCGSRGLGHQIGTEFLRRMAIDAAKHGIDLPDRELACAPLDSALGREYLDAMRAGINCALANRQIVTHFARQVFSRVLPRAQLGLLYDVSHNTCKVEEHLVDGLLRSLFVHRKGATRAFGPGDRSLPEAFVGVGQPVLIGGTMGTSSYILVGTERAEALSFGSACHGAGRSMSRNEAKRRWRGADVVRDLDAHGILVRSNSLRGVAEEAPPAYKDVTAVVEAADRAGLARKVARLEPLVCIKG